MTHLRLRLVKRVPAVAGLALAVTGAPMLSGAAHAGPPPTCPAGVVSLTAGQPLDGTTLKVARIGGAHAGLPVTWEMKYDAFICNKTAQNAAVSSVKIEHLSGSTVTLTKTILPGSALSNTSVSAGASNQPVFVRDHTQFAYPLPSSIRLTVVVTRSGGTNTFTRNYLVADQVNPGPLQGYLFPSRQVDLPAGSYWAQGRHAETNTYQRFAYDLGVVRWTGSQWTDRKPGASLTSKVMTDYGSFGKPIFAMSDGEIIGCNRGAADHDAGAAAGNVAGGNILWVRSGNETTLYAHLKQNSIPFALCPFTDDAEHKLADPNANPPADAPYRIKAGQFLGNSGSSGYSLSGPHLHIHTFAGLPGIWGGSETGFDSDSRPFRFYNVKVQEKKDTAAASSSAWNLLSSSAVLPYNTLISPNPCGYLPSSYAGRAEVLNRGVPGGCFLEMFNAMRQAGLRPVHIDVHGTGASSNSTTTWRPSDGTAWAMYAGLDANGLQQRHNTLVTAQGYRYLQLETYAEGGKVKYAVIFIKGQPGPSQYARAGLTNAQNTSVFNTQVAAGWRPVNRSVAVLYEKANIGSSWVAKPAIPLSGYQNEFNANLGAGRQPAYLDGYELGGVAYVSAIFQNGLKGSFSASHGMSNAQLGANEASNLASGRYVYSVTEYKEAGLTRYAATWRPAPGTAIGTKPASGTSTSATFSFSSTSDSTATFECKLDSGAWAACSSPKSYSGLSKTSHTFSVRAVDRTRLRDATPATHTWTIS